MAGVRCNAARNASTCRRSVSSCSIRFEDAISSVLQRGPRASNLPPRPWSCSDKRAREIANRRNPARLEIESLHAVGHRLTTRPRRFVTPHTAIESRGVITSSEDRAAPVSSHSGLRHQLHWLRALADLDLVELLEVHAHSPAVHRRRARELENV